MLGKVTKFLSEVKVELSKVTWSSRQELVHSTIIVLVTMAFLAVYIGIIDSLFSTLVRIIMR